MKRKLQFQPCYYSRQDYTLCGTRKCDHTDLSDGSCTRKGMGEKEEKRSYVSSVCMLLTKSITYPTYHKCYSSTKKDADIFLNDPGGSFVRLMQNTKFALDVPGWDPWTCRFSGAMYFNDIAVRILERKSTMDIPVSPHCGLETTGARVQCSSTAEYKQLAAFHP